MTERNLLRVNLAEDGAGTTITDGDGNPINGLCAVSISVSPGEKTRAMMLMELSQSAATIRGENASWCVLVGGRPEAVTTINLADGRVIDFSTGIPRFS